MNSPPVALPPKNTIARPMEMTRDDSREPSDLRGVHRSRPFNSIQEEAAFFETRIAQSNKLDRKTISRGQRRLSPDAQSPNQPIHPVPDQPIHPSSSAPKVLPRLFRSKAVDSKDKGGASELGPKSDSRVLGGSGGPRLIGAEEGRRVGPEPEKRG